MQQENVSAVSNRMQTHVPNNVKHNKPNNAAPPTSIPLVEDVSSVTVTPPTHASNNNNNNNNNKFNNNNNTGKRNTILDKQQLLLVSELKQHAPPDQTQIQHKHKQPSVPTSHKHQTETQLPVTVNSKSQPQKKISQSHTQTTQTQTTCVSEKSEQKSPVVSPKASVGVQGLCPFKLTLIPSISTDCADTISHRLSLVPSNSMGYCLSPSLKRIGEHAITVELNKHGLIVRRNSVKGRYIVTSKPRKKGTYVFYIL